MRPRSKLYTKIVLRVAVSAGLLFWLFSETDPSLLLEAFCDISPGIWVSAFLMYIASQLVSSTRWYVLARGLGFPGRLSTYTGYYFVGMYFNLFLPTSLGGDVLKVLFLSRGEAPRLRASYSVIMDRLLGLAAMFWLGAGAIFLHQGMLPARFAIFLYSAALSTLIIPFLVPGIHGLISRPWPEMGSRLSPLVELWQRPLTVATGFLLSLVLQSLGMGAVAMLGHDMSLSLPTAFYFAAFPLVAILTLLPVSFNGIGLREGGFVYFLGLKGIPAEKALTLSLSFFAVQVAASLIGGLAYVSGFHQKRLGA